MARNLILNPSFEIAGGGGQDVFATWLETFEGTGTVVDEGAEVHSGSHSAKLTGDGSDNNYGRVIQTVAVVIGITYRLSFWVKGPFSTGYWFDPDGDPVGGAIHGNNADWAQTIIYYEAPHTSFRYYFLSNVDGTPGSAYFDGAVVIPGMGVPLGMGKDF